MTVYGGDKSHSQKMLEAGYRLVPDEKNPQRLKWVKESEESRPKNSKRRQPFKPLPLESGLTEAESQEQDELRDVSMGDVLLEKEKTLNKILKNVLKILKRVNRIEVNQIKLEKELIDNGKKRKRIVER